MTERLNMLPDGSRVEPRVSEIGPIKPDLVNNSLYLSEDDFALILNLLRNTPSQLTDEQLRKTPLPILTGSLGEHSSRIVIDTYLRWLEIQRQAPKGNCNSNWQVVITCWTQSLRARGFSLSEVTEEVSKWKAADGPFNSCRTVVGETRLPPSSVQLESSWRKIRQEAVGSLRFSGLSSKTYTELVDKMYDKILTAVPSYYVCNRCKGKGEKLLIHQRNRH
jgi:hypothetical protein